MFFLLDNAMGDKQEKTKGPEDGYTYIEQTANY